MLTLVAGIASVGYAESGSPAEIDRGERRGEATVEAAAADGSDAAVRAELSVAPLSHVVYPEDRPAWIEQSPDLQSDPHTWVVTTAGYESLSQCEEELAVLTPAAVSLYIKETADWVCPEEFLDPQWIDDQLIGKRYVGTFHRGDAEWHEIAVELQFDGEARRRIAEAKQNSVVRERLQAAGGLFALGLAGLCCSGGLLSVFSRRFS
jgi:hypothetical protein